MKIVIAHKKLSREINGSGFEICGSREDLKSVAHQLCKALDDPNWSYGWVEIREECNHRPTNKPPVQWEEK